MLVARAFHLKWHSPGEKPRLPLRASSIGVDARVTLMDARGKPEAGATEQRDPGRPPWTCPVFDDT